MKTDFPDADDILNFALTIEPDEGMYRGGRFSFSFAISHNFPHEPPKVRCKEKIYHPNIDLDGKVCLNILREDWKPVLNLNAVIVGLQVRRAWPGKDYEPCEGGWGRHARPRESADQARLQSSSCSSNPTPRTRLTRRRPKTCDSTGRASSAT
jgi:hypothetical protein